MRRVGKMTSNYNDAIYSILGQTLQLMAERAIFWQEHQTLLVADLHLGKEGTFRAAGIPLPEGPSRDTVERLEKALSRTQAKRLVILGDLFHGDSAVVSSGTLIDGLRSRFAELHIDLISGSHDRWSGNLPEKWRFNIHSAGMHAPPFLFRHYPETEEGSYVLSGHIHPGFLLRDKQSGETMKLSCFHFKESLGILPAFGSFTGLTTISSLAEELNYVIAERSVLLVPGE